MAYVIPNPTSHSEAVPVASAPVASAKRGLSWLSQRLADPYRSLLILRFALLNVLAFALLGVAYAQGLVHNVVEADATYLSVIIFLVFLVGLGLCAQKVWQTSSELDSVRGAGARHHPKVDEYLGPLKGVKPESRASLSGSLRMKLSYRISVVRHLANTLVLLGLIGTVLGFIIALSGVDPEHASDINAISPMVSTLIQGMSTALYTTLVGSILNVWLMANHQLLAGGTVNLISALLEAVESNERN